MAGNPLYRVNADGGARRGLLNVTGQPIRSWDARGHAFRLVYDPAQRPTRRYVSSDGGAEILTDLSVYGEGQPAANLCGRAVPALRHALATRRTAGTTTRGNLVSSVRQLAADYHQAVNWTPLASLTTAAELDAAAAAAGLVPAGDGGRDAFTGQRGVRRAEPAHSGGHAAQRGHEARRRPARLRRGGPAQPSGRMAAAGRRARRATGPGHGRPARGHRHRATTRAASASRSATATAPARPTPTTRRPSGWRGSPPPGPGRSPPASGPSRTWPTTTTRPGTSPGSATTPTPRT